MYLYERLSDGIHRYSAPSEREYYNVSVVTSHGSLLFQPDIVFRPREPGLSAVECVAPAVRKVVPMGLRKKAITSGVSVLEREQDLKRTSKKGR